MANDRLEELQQEINAKIAEAVEIAERLSGAELRLTTGTEEVVFDGCAWRFPNDDNGWYSSSMSC